MRKTRVAPFLIGVLSGLLLAGPATAAPITVGSPLTAPVSSATGALKEETLTNIALRDPGAKLTSPVDGVIVRWRVVDATGTWRLRVLRPLGGTSYLGAGTSAPASPASTGTEVFATYLPVRAGDAIGLDSTLGATIGFASGGMLAGWVPPLADGASAGYLDTEAAEVAFNADVQPPPTVTSLSPGAGSFKGGTAVTVSGTDFAGVSSVNFGGVAATGLTVNSEGSLTVVAPASAPGRVADVTVTTIAGTSPLTAADRFEYVACVVPGLGGLKLKAAKKKLKKAHCTLGQVTKREGATAKTGRVAKQGPKAGRTLAPGAKVNLTLR